MNVLANDRGTSGVYICFNLHSCTNRLHVRRWCISNNLLSCAPSSHHCFPFTRSRFSQRPVPRRYGRKAQGDTDCLLTASMLPATRSVANAPHPAACHVPRVACVQHGEAKTSQPRVHHAHPTLSAETRPRHHCAAPDGFKARGVLPRLPVQRAGSGGHMGRGAARAAPSGGGACHAERADSVASLAIARGLGARHIMTLSHLERPGPREVSSNPRRANTIRGRRPTARPHLT